MNVFEKLSRQYKTPYQVQKFIRSLQYNNEENGETIRSALQVLKLKKAHCLEAAVLAAAILEHRGYEPLVMSLESQDLLDHVLFIFKEKSGWGAVSRSRDHGLHGRAPKFRTPRTLALSYFEPYVDETGRITAFGVANLDHSNTSWRDSNRNLWKLEDFLNEVKHQKLKTSDASYEKILNRFKKQKPSTKLGKFHW
jgi:hypothetical protein